MAHQTLMVRVGRADPRPLKSAEGPNADAILLAAKIEHIRECERSGQDLSRVEYSIAKASESK